MLTTVIFDLDDTLYDEIDFCHSGFHAAAEHIAALSDAPPKRIIDKLGNLAKLLSDY
jgi:hypothetical protein